MCKYNQKYDQRDSKRSTDLESMSGVESRNDAHVSAACNLHEPESQRKAAASFSDTLSNPLSSRLTYRKAVERQRYGAEHF